MKKDENITGPAKRGPSLKILCEVDQPTYPESDDLEDAEPESEVQPEEQSETSDTW